ncbi:hypothetical protein ACVBEQ_23520 [Nakamurella sp. GG22]
MTTLRHGSASRAELTAARGGEPAAEPTVRHALPAYWLSGALLLVVCIAAGLTYFWDGLLTGPAAMNGSARGTALVLLVLTAPVLAVSMAVAARGSARAVIVWLGALGTIVYNAQMLLYGTPFNQLFLLYVAMLGLSLWSVGTLLAGGTVGRLATRMSAAMPVRPLAVYVWVIAGLNALLWLRTIVPAILDERPSSVVDGTGIATNPVFVQDLAIWLPLAVIAGIWFWRGRDLGFVVVGGLLAMWVLEGVTVAVDQWFGAAADPASTVVSSSAVVPLAVLAVVGLAALLAFLRSVLCRPAAQSE